MSRGLLSLLGLAGRTERGVSHLSLHSLIADKRTSLGINGYNSAIAQCRRVNLEIVAHLNRNKGLNAIALRDPNFRNFTSSHVYGEHVVGIVENEGVYYGFDGTADQVRSSGTEILIVSAPSLEDTIIQLNYSLGGNFHQQVLGYNSYGSM